MKQDTITTVLGAEHDITLRRALLDILMSLGGSIVGREWSVVGSQEIGTLEVDIGGRNIKVEAETYIGLSITGDLDIVNAVSALVKGKLAR